MEGDVVLPDEVVVPRLGVLPERFPVVGLPDHPGVLHRCAQVSDDGLEPHVDDLVVPSLDGDRDAPGHVPGDGPVVEAVLQPVPGEGLDVGPPPLLALEVFEQGLPERAQLQEEVLGLADLRGAVAQGAVRFEEVPGLEGHAARVALVAAGLLGPAVGADPLDVPVGEEPGAVGAVVLVRLLSVDVPLVPEVVEQPLDHLEVGRAVGLVVQGVLDAHVLDGLLVDLVELVGVLLRRHARLLGGDGDGGAVLVGAADHEDLVADDAVVPAEYVRRQ